MLKMFLQQAMSIGLAQNEIIYVYENEDLLTIDNRHKVLSISKVSDKYIMALIMV